MLHESLKHMSFNVIRRTVHVATRRNCAFNNNIYLTLMTLRILLQRLHMYIYM